MRTEDLAAAVFRESFLRGRFVLRSGRVADEYFDKYQFEGRPELLGAIASALSSHVPPKAEVLAGLELGGIPVVTALSLVTGMPAAFVRKEAKMHGTARLAEGVPVAGREVLIVEDVVTSGGQILLSAGDLREAGAHISYALCVVDREEGGKERLKDEGIELISLFTASELRAAGQSIDIERQRSR